MRLDANHDSPEEQYVRFSGSMLDYPSTAKFRDYGKTDVQIRNRGLFNVNTGLTYHTPSQNGLKG